MPEIPFPLFIYFHLYFTCINSIHNRIAFLFKFAHNLIRTGFFNFERIFPLAFIKFSEKTLELNMLCCTRYNRYKCRKNRLNYLIFFGLYESYAFFKSKNVFPNLDIETPVPNIEGKYRFIY